MLNIKKTVVWAALAVVILSLPACVLSVGKDGKGESTLETTESAQAAQREKVKIGISIYRYDDNFMKLYRDELKQYLEEAYGAEVNMRNARNEREDQASQVTGFLENGCSAVIVNLVDIDDAPAIANLCHREGVPLVFINREPDLEEQERWKQEKLSVSYIGTDSKQAGTYQGEIILETRNKGDFNGDGIVSYIMIMGESNHIDAENRTLYSIKALGDGGMKTEPLYAERGNWEEARGEEIAAKALSTYKNRIEVIFCNNDAMCNGALSAVLAAGRKPGKDICLVGVDALENTVRYVKEGNVTGTVFNDHKEQSHLAADVAMKLLKGEKAEYHYNVDYLKITIVSTFK